MAEYRLAKVATELNRSFQALADLLNQQGFDVMPKPTTKITEDMYQALLREFSADKAAKDEAKLLKSNRDPKPATAAPVAAKPTTVSPASWNSVAVPISVSDELATLMVAALVSRIESAFADMQIAALKLRLHLIAARNDLVIKPLQPGFSFTRRRFRGVEESRGVAEDVGRLVAAVVDDVRWPAA